MRVTSAVHQVADELLAPIRPWPPPPEAAAQTELLLWFILEGCGALGGSAPESVVAAYRGLFGVLNGYLWEPQFVHYCRGPTCCPEGRVTTHKRIVEGLLAGPLRARPSCRDCHKQMQRKPKAKNLGAKPSERTEK